MNPKYSKDDILIDGPKGNKVKIVEVDRARQEYKLKLIYLVDEPVKIKLGETLTYSFVEMHSAENIRICLFDILNKL